MILEIAQNGKYCTDRRDGSGQRWTWKEVQTYIETEAPKEIKFTYILKNQDERDHLGYLTDLILCVYCHPDTDLKVFIECSDDSYMKNINKLRNALNFLLLFYENFQLRVNGIQIKAEAEKKHQIPMNYLPFITLDETVYNKLFKMNLRELPYGSQIMCGLEEASELPLTFDNYYENLILGTAFRYLFSGAVPAGRSSRLVLNEIYIDCFAGNNLFTVLFCCIIYNKTKEKGENFGQSTIGRVKHALNMAFTYKLGVEEIIENIMKHTLLRKGVLYLRLQTEQKSQERFQTAALTDGQWGFSKSDNVRNDWLELTVIDAGDMGILERYREEENVSLSRLSEMFCKKSIESVISLNEKEIKKAIYQKGLRIFADHIIKSGGMFSVTTSNQEGSCYYLKYDEIEKEGFEADSSVGTQYKVWLPIANLNNTYFQQFPINIRIRDEYRVFINQPGFEGNGEDAKTQFLEKKDRYRLRGIRTDNREAYVLEEVQNIGKFIAEHKDKQVLYFDFNNEEDICLVKVAFAIALLSRNNSAQTIILYNIGNSKAEISAGNVFDNLCNVLITNYADVLKCEYADEKVRRSSPCFYFYDSAGSPVYITKNFDKEMTAALLKCMYDYRSIFYELDSYYEHELPENIRSLNDSDKQALLTPWELAEFDNKFSAPIFERHLNRLFETDIADDRRFGLRFTGHVRLGNKLHVDRFYQAEMLFDNNYYLGSLALVLARQIKYDILRDDTNSQKRLFLVGYEEYSIGLLEKVMQIIGENLFEGMYIYEEKETEELLCDTIAGCIFVVIVPIVSTLKTFNKVISYLKNQFGREIKMEHYTFFVSRDAASAEGENKGQATEREREYGWKEIDTTGKTILISSDDKEDEYNRIHYFMMVLARWNLSLECKLCKENEILLETKDKSLRLDTKFGLPYNEDTNTVSPHIQPIDNRGRLQEAYLRLAEFVGEGHYSRLGNHYKYYIKLNEFFSGYVKDSGEFRDWMQTIRSYLKDNEEAVNVLLVPRHNSNKNFVNIINKEVFGENTIIINENFHEEFYSDFNKKYSFLSRMKNIRYVFLDDCISTGRTYSKCMSLVKGTWHSAGEAEYIVINLISRLDYHNKVMLESQNEIRFTYMNVDIPSIKEQEGKCWLCEEFDRQKRYQAEYSSMCMQNFFARSYGRLKAVEIDDEYRTEKTEKIRIKKNTKTNFLITDIIYYKLFELHREYGDTADEKVLLEILGLNSKYNIVKKIYEDGEEINDSYRIAFVKSLSRSFLGEFYTLKKIALKICDAETERLFRSGRQLTKNKNPEMILKYLIVLIKRYGRLGSRRILEADWMERCWKLYRKLKTRIGDEELRNILNNKPFGLHYAVAVRRLVSKNPVNSIFLFEQMQSGFSLLLEAESDAKSEYIRFLEYCFCSENYTLTSAYDNFLKDKKGRDQDFKLKSYYYSNFHYLLALCGLNNGKEILYAIERVKNKMAGNNEIGEGTDSTKEQAFGALMSLVLKPEEDTSGTASVIFYSVNESFGEKEVCHLTLGRLSPSKMNSGQRDGGRQTLSEAGLSMCKSEESCMRIKMNRSDYEKERNISMNSRYLIFNFSRLLPKKNNKIAVGMLLIADISRASITFNAGKAVLAYQIFFNIFEKVLNVEKYVNEAVKNDVIASQKEVDIKRGMVVKGR